MFLIVCEYKTYKNTLEMSSCTSINSGFYLKIIPVKLAVFDMKKGVL